MPSLTVSPVSPPAGRVYGVTSGNELVSFDAASASTIRTRAAITGLNANDWLVGIDFRPVNNLLYGLDHARRAAARRCRVRTSTPPSIAFVWSATRAPRSSCWMPTRPRGRSGSAERRHPQDLAIVGNSAVIRALSISLGR